MLGVAIGEVVIMGVFVIEGRFGDQVFVFQHMLQHVASRLQNFKIQSISSFESC